MFIQVIQGQARHAEPIYVELDQWMKELASSAAGWLGTTAGVTGDGRFIGFSRWESEQAARTHSARPDQDHWWRAFSVLFAERPTFIESHDIFLDLHGDPNKARFVQFMQGRGRNPGRARELMGAHREQWAAFRPEILGTVGCLYGDGEYTMASYYVDESSAREGERKQPPPELKAEMDEMMSLAEGAPQFFDLREPWIEAPV